MARTLFRCFCSALLSDTSAVESGSACCACTVQKHVQCNKFCVCVCVCCVEFMGSLQQAMPLQPQCTHAWFVVDDETGLSIMIQV